MTTKLIECWLWIFTIFVCMSLGIWFHDRTYKNIENDEKADYQNGSVRKSLRSGLQFPTTTSTSNSMVQNITESGVDVVEKCAQGQKVSICVIAIADNWTHRSVKTWIGVRPHHWDLQRPENDPCNQRLPCFTQINKHGGRSCLNKVINWTEKRWPVFGFTHLSFWTRNKSILGEKYSIHIKKGRQNAKSAVFKRICILILNGWDG